MNKTLHSILQASSLKTRTCRAVIITYCVGLFAMLGLSSMLSAQLAWAPDEDTSVNGSGTWSTSEISWASGSDPRQAWVNGSNAILGRVGGTSGAPLAPAGDYTITIDGSITVSNVRQISETGNPSQYTLTGGTINLSDGGGSAGFRADQGTLTINSDIVYTGSDTQRLEGDFILGGNNNVTNWHMRSGTTTLNSANALGGNGALGWHTNSTLELNGFSLHAGRTINFADGRRTGTISNSSAMASTITGTISTLTDAQATGNRVLAFDGPGIIRHTGNIVGGTDAGAEQIRVLDGAKFILDGDGSGYTGNFEVLNGGFIGGGGSLGSDLTLAGGAGLLFDPSATLTISGSVVLNNLGVSDLLFIDGEGIVWTEISDGVYTLIDGTITGSLLHDSSNPFDLGSGRQAYFQLGSSLDLVVVPEPSHYALLGGLMAFLTLILSRLRK